MLALLAGSAALVLLTLAAAGAMVVAPSGTAAAVGGAGPSGGWGIGVVLAVVAGLLGGAYVALGRLVQRFVFVDYDIHHVGKRPAH